MFNEDSKHLCIILFAIIYKFVMKVFIACALHMRMHS